MNNRDKSHSLEKFIIDLTPLLDVVLLMLIVVLYSNANSVEREKENNQIKVAEQQSLVEQANDQVADANAQYAAAANQLNNYENLNNYVNVITVYASYQESYRWNRTIYVSINNGEIVTFDVNQENESTIWDECRTYIENNVPNRDIPTVISIDNSYISEDAKMLYRDELKLLQLYSDLNFDIKYPGYNTEINNE